MNKIIELFIQVFALSNAFVGACSSKPISIETRDLCGVIHKILETHSPIIANDLFDENHFVRVHPVEQHEAFVVYTNLASMMEEVLSNQDVLEEFAKHRWETNTIGKRISKNCILTEDKKMLSQKVVPGLMDVVDSLSENPFSLYAYLYHLVNENIHFFPSSGHMFWSVFMTNLTEYERCAMATAASLCHSKADILATQNVLSMGLFGEMSSM